MENIKNYTGTDAILVKEELAYALPVKVDAPSTPVDADGNKYLLAGTLLTADKDVLLANEVVVMTPTTDVSKAQGILLHDTNVVSGPNKAALLTSGFVNRNMMDNSTKTQYYTDDQVHKMKSSLPNITVIDR